MGHQGSWAGSTPGKPGLASQYQISSSNFSNRSFGKWEVLQLQESGERGGGDDEGLLLEEVALREGQDSGFERHGEALSAR